MRIRTLIADDHPAIVSGVRHTLGRTASIHVVGTACDSGEVVNMLTAGLVDALVTDYIMPRGAYGDGMEFLAYLRQSFPNLRIIVFTALDNCTVNQALAELGVHAVVNKAADPALLVSAVVVAHRGARFYPRERGDRANLHSISRPSGGDITSLEREFIRLYSRGWSIDDIAICLERPREQISQLKADVMSKLDVAHDADLYSYAYETDLL
ncbi:response regulator [Achromobacter sp. Root565]|uniref:response regulator n=1 Tax=Achromobacter sp. Root565 TaxID=1736564 RepID=UPI0006F477EA|nr:response regulator [Achromobacter sp. Root565]KRA01266.1 hypothetical protein ASD71_04025 [Achromobacter sp. Root565]